jgi:hypothetical protein
VFVCKHASSRRDIVAHDELIEEREGRENLIRTPVGPADGRQSENHTSQGHQRYETRNASATNSIRQLCVALPPGGDVRERSSIDPKTHPSGEAVGGRA